MELPCVDLRAQDAAVQMDRACQGMGLFYLSGHGLGDSDLASVLESARALFSASHVPAEDRPVVTRHSGGFLRGYIAKGGESGSGDAEPAKESFAYGFEWTTPLEPGAADAPGTELNKDDRLRKAEHGAERDPQSVSGVHFPSHGTDSILGRDAGPVRSCEQLSEGGEGPRMQNPLQGHNVWPQRLPPSHRDTLQRYFRVCCHAALALVELMGQALGIPTAELAALCDGGDTISLMRVFRYMAGSKGTLGSSPHTDWGFWTIILQEPGVSGLQVWHKEQWVSVPPRPGTLVVNVGDFLAVYTRQRWRSPLHQVVAESDQERMSLVFFQYPRFKARLPKGSSDATLSLFQYQGVEQAGCARQDEAGVPELSFGELILRKWAQVQRSTSAC